MYRNAWLGFACFIVIFFYICIEQNHTGASREPEQIATSMTEARAAPLCESPLSDLARSDVVKTNQVFSMTITATPSIGYFSGQINCLGEVIPQDQKRLMAGERLNLSLMFSQEPQSIEVILNGKIWHFNVPPGVTRYETGIILPDWEPTISFSGERLNPPMTLTVRARARYDAGLTTEQSISGFELTGDVRQLVRVQPIRP